MRSSLKKRQFSYYSFNKVLSYNAAYNFIVGARGLGKTYGAKKRVIRAFLNHGEQFIYLRRYKTEMKSARPAFFADITNEFPDHDFRIHGNMAQVATAETRDDDKRDWRTMGFFVSLSNAQSQKSVAYPMVTSIIYDEFIIEKGALHYLPNEAKAFNDFYSTVDRWQDKTRVFFLANALSIMNPYFLEYDIKPDEAKEYTTYGDGFIVAHFADSANFTNEVYQTRFGKFIKDTDYAEYSVASQFHDNEKRQVGFKPSEAIYLCSVETKMGTFSVWNYMGDEFMSFYVQAKRPKQERMFTFVPEWMDEGKALMHYADKIPQTLRTAFKRGRVWFDEPRTRNAFVEIFRR